jgi:hypothetical protein
MTYEIQFHDLPDLELKDYKDLEKTAIDMLRQAQMMIIINRQLLLIALDGIEKNKHCGKIPEEKIAYAG